MIDLYMELMFDPVIAGFVLFGLFFLLLFLGTPIAVAIAVSSIAVGLAYLPPDTAFFVATQKMFSGLDSFTLLAIPFFILAGDIMNKGGIATRLIDLAKLMAGRLPGALAHANVIANMLFGAISGSAIAAAAAVGGIMGPRQKEEGYARDYSAAVNIASAPTGILIPPSGPLILYSLVSGGTSISALFIAGYIPGIIMGLSVMVVAGIMASRRGYKSDDERPTPKEALVIAWRALPAVAMVLVVIGGIVLGVFTATEAAAVAVLYALGLSLIYNLATFREYIYLLCNSAILTASILFLIAASGIMSYVMTMAGIPDMIADAILTFDSPIAVFLVMNLCLLVIGFFVDLTPAVLIFTPIFLPIAREMGMDPVHFGIMLIFNLGVGSMTPPVGSVLFVGCSVAGIPVERVFKPIFPIFVMLVVALLLVTFVPWLSLALPRLFGLM